MKCYYEVLNISREADTTEIKNAYRKLALRWHPDKNLNKPDEAKEQFQTVQNAYEVLSDPQERAWYDSHREQLLRGAGTSFNDESLDLIPFFTPSCYKGFGDDEKGFYAVYKEVFKKLAAEEVDYLDDPEDISEIPMFGDSSTEYEKVHEFYAYWMSFSTSKSYVWLDKYDIRQADNRKILKLLEKENNKIRQKARKERNEEIRQLVSFVRRRDKRVIAYTKLLQEKAEENKRKAEQMRKDKHAQRQRELEEAKQRHSDLYSMNDFHTQLDEIEKHLAEEFGHSDEETLTGPSDDEECDIQENQGTIPEINGTLSEGQAQTEKNYTASQSLYCTACSKLFKNIKSFENHENSKKHKENVMNMKLDTELEFSGDEEETDVQNEEENGKVKDAELDEDECLDISDDEQINKHIEEAKKKKKNKKKSQLFNVRNFGIENSEVLDDLNAMSRSRRSKKEKYLEKSSKAKETKVKPVDSDILPLENTKEEHNDAETINLLNGPNEIEENGEEKEKVAKSKVEKKVPTVTKEKEKKYTQKQKDIIANEIDLSTLDTSHCCAICKVEFSSKNKLFDHLKKTGHQIYLPTAQVQAPSKVSKKKGSKNR